MTRRQLIALVGSLAVAGVDLRATADRVVKKGRLKQSVSRWPYAKIPLPEFCRAIAEMGLPAIDLLEEPDWQGAREHGLVVAIAYAVGGSISNRLTVTANHDAIAPNFDQNI